MRQMIVLLVFAFCLTTQVDAQQAADGFRIGIQAGAGPYYGLVGLVGVQVDYTITDRLRGGFRGTIVDFVGPCADPDPQLNPNPCIADGQTWLLLLSYRTERARRAVEPYIEFAGGGYRFTDQLENGEWAPFVDVETGLRSGGRG